MFHQSLNLFQLSFNGEQGFARARACSASCLPCYDHFESELKQRIWGQLFSFSIQEELKRAAAAEREKRAAAAERRIAAAALLNAQGPSSSQPKSGMSTDINCSYCYSSLDGKIPFHRYNYKYCSTTCMHVHREILEDA